MACQKVCKQVRDDSTKAKINIKVAGGTSLHFFTLQFRQCMFPEITTCGRVVWV